NGITYDVPYEMEEMDSKDKTDAIHLYPGRQKLDGEEALALVRTRKYDSDVERGKRQQEVIEIIADKVTSASSIFKLNQLIEAIRPNLKTDLYMNDIKSFMEYGLDKDFNIEKINLEGDGDYMDDGLWYFHADEDSLIDVQRELRNHLDLPAYSSDDEETDDNSYDEEEEDNNKEDDSYSEEGRYQVET